MNILLFLIKFLCIFICIMGAFHAITRKWLNPYKLIFVFGKKGSGKSTLLAKWSNRDLKRGWTVYSTEAEKPQSKYIDLTVQPDKTIINYIEPRHLYEYNFPARSAVFIDEASLIWDNRDFKSMDKKIIEWFRYQRHHKVKVYLFSQTFDIDKKLRDLADDMWLVNKYFRVFVIAKHMIRKPVVVHPSPDAPARIDDDIIIDSPFMALFGGRSVAFIPYWAKRFDSHRTDVCSYTQE